MITFIDGENNKGVEQAMKNNEIINQVMKNLKLYLVMKKFNNLLNLEKKLFVITIL